MGIKKIIIFCCLKVLELAGVFALGVLSYFVGLWDPLNFIPDYQVPTTLSLIITGAAELVVCGFFLVFGILVIYLVGGGILYTNWNWADKIHNKYFKK